MKFSTILPFAAGALAVVERDIITSVTEIGTVIDGVETSITTVITTSVPDVIPTTTTTEASSTDSSSTDSSSTESSTDASSTESTSTESTSTESSSETVTTTTDGATDPTDISTTLPVVITTSTSAGFNTSSTSTSASSETTTTAAPLTTLATFTLQIEGIIGLDGAIGAVRLGFFQFAIDFAASTMALLEDGSVVDGAGLAFSVPSSRGLRRRQESAAGSRIFLIDPADADYETCVCSLSDANELNCDCDGLTGFQVGTTDPYVGILGIGDVDADGFVDFIPVVVIDEDNTSTTTTGTAGGDATLTAPVYGYPTGGAGAPSYSTEVVGDFTTYCPYPTTITYGPSPSQTHVVTEAGTVTITDCPCTITKTVDQGAVATHPAGGNGGAAAGNGGAAAGNNGDAVSGSDNGSGAASGSGSAPSYDAGAANNGGSGADQAGAQAGAGSAPAADGASSGAAGAAPGQAGAAGGSGNAVQQIGDGQIQNPADGGAASPAGGADGGAASPAGGAAGAASPAGGNSGAASPAGGDSGASPSSSTPEAYQGAASSVQASFGFAVAMIAIAAF